MKINVKHHVIKRICEIVRDVWKILMRYVLIFCRNKKDQNLETLITKCYGIK